MLRKYVLLSVIMVMILGLFACGGPKGDLFPDSKLATAIWEAIDKVRDRQWQILVAAGGGAALAFINLVILLHAAPPF